LRLTAILFITILPLAAQARTPRTKDGKPNLAAPAPKMNGKPDLSGVWQAERTPVSEFTRVFGKDIPNLQVDLNDITKEAYNVFWGMKPEEEPLRPEGAAIVKERRGKSDPLTYCLPAGIPEALFITNFKIVQAPQEMVMVLESGDPARQIHLDGRDLPKDPVPSWLGSSTGHWQGDTLIIETTGFTETSWLDSMGHPRSEGMVIREAYHRRDFGRMDLELTFEDTKYYTRPFSFKTQLTLIPDTDVFEYVCNENEQDLRHTKK
jgi:hypothetical protein